MISIIVAIHNQLTINEIFYDSLKKYTYHPFELIIINNASTDGSDEYFQRVGAVVINNEANYSYPYCQNQGIKAAKYNYLAFLNNDLIVGVHWDKAIIESMEHNGLDIITTSGLERVESRTESKALRKKWNIIKNVISQFGKNKFNLRLMHKLMYGNWENFCAKRAEKYKGQVVEGILGHSVIMKKAALEKVGMWDERLQAADFDLFLRTKKRSIEVGDIKPVHYALDVFNHHFIRFTVKAAGKKMTFADQQNMIKLEDKWDREEMDFLLKDSIHE